MTHRQMLNEIAMVICVSIFALIWAWMITSY